MFFDAGSKKNNSDVVSQPVHRYPDTKPNERVSEGSNCVENVRYHNMQPNKSSHIEGYLDPVIG